MLAIDGEIRIERQDGVSLVDFRHTHDAGIRERHRSVAIFLVELSQGRQVFFDAESDGKSALFEQRQQCVLAGWEGRKQIHRFRQYGLAQKQRSIQLVDMSDCPSVMSLGAIQECDKRTGVNDCDGHLGRTRPGVWDSRRGPEHPSR